MMSFEEFSKNVAENIKMYLPNEYAGAEVELKNVIKNNDVELTGISIRNIGNDIFPNIYLEGYYDKYVDGAEMNDIMQAIADVRVSHEVDKDFDIRAMTDFDQVKDKIICKIINAEMNAEYLVNKPYTQVEDLAVTYAVDLGGSEFGHMTTAITENLLKNYGISKEELHKIAMVNLADSQIEFKSMRDVLIDMMFPDGIDEGDPRVYMLPPEEETPFMYVLSNGDKMNGAAAILDSKTMEDISEKLGGDFIVLPSSVHEVIILPGSVGADRHQLEEMVQSINAGEVPPEERLSDNVYMYDSIEKELVRADKYEDRRQQREEAKHDVDVKRDEKSDRSEKKPERERVSMKEKIAEKKAVVAKNEATREHPVKSKARETALV